MDTSFWIRPWLAALGAANQPGTVAPDSNDQRVILLLIGAGLILGVMVTILVLISRSLTKLRRGAERFAHGDLSQKVQVYGPLQIAELAESLNQMADQLRERLNTVVRQRNELGAVLASMTEGVLAVDLNEQVLSLNPAAARMLSTDPSTALGRHIQEVVRNTALQHFITQTLAGETGVRGDLVLRADTDGPTGNGTPSDRLIEAQGTSLRDGEGNRIGALIVLNDVTRLRRLESVRHDFVANVSHEIKTPVTAIKAAAETLLTDSHSFPPDANRFLHIVARQSDRLGAIIEDLLSLARIEQDAKHQRIELSPGPIAAVVRSAIETCEARAAARRIEVTAMVEPDLSVAINAPLLEQAIVNLLDNAIKYSPEGGMVRVQALRQRDEVVIWVVDNGVGIEAEHLPRLFERFYRTDKARSRALGGTGLGLAIVKHIAQTHGGRVSVLSTPSPVANQGSTFRIHLPAG